ncbi:hypothetical protein RFI_37697 [Reticulomyxa filosa]|uniref:Secreted protein n=1 Tax=Reticulomyxa filosa TaxID=46433 RepID=X6LCL8_RETFI|nr:hypothetical protein RFI_37697 [Reticulomyxa filosa]|eukprot:ETN99772.1 hypothetical protein RFI_37697 [Reticulomyxa filosa]
MRFMSCFLFCFAFFLSQYYQTHCAFFDELITVCGRTKFYLAKKVEMILKKCRHLLIATVPTIYSANQNIVIRKCRQQHFFQKKNGADLFSVECKINCHLQNYTRQNEKKSNQKLSQMMASILFQNYMTVYIRKRQNK